MNLVRSLCFFHVSQHRRFIPAIWIVQAGKIAYSKERTGYSTYRRVEKSLKHRQDQSMSQPHLIDKEEVREGDVKEEGGTRLTEDFWLSFLLSHCPKIFCICQSHNKNSRRAAQQLNWKDTFTALFDTNWHVGDMAADYLWKLPKSIHFQLNQRDQYI